MSGYTTTTDLHIRIDSDLKSEAEAVFEELGVSPSNAVSIFYKQVVMQGGIPFQVVKHYRNAPDLDTMTTAQLDAELKKGMDDYKAGHVHSLKDTFSKMDGAQYEKV